MRARPARTCCHLRTHTNSHAHTLAELAKTSLTDFLEVRVAKLLEGTGAEPVTIRMLMNVDKSFEAGPLRKARCVRVSVLYA